MKGIHITESAILLYLRRGTALPARTMSPLGRELPSTSRRTGILKFRTERRVSAKGGRWIIFTLKRESLN